MRSIEKTNDYEVFLHEENGEKFKCFRSLDANYDMNMQTGQMLLWGKTLEDDPDYFPAPNIADIEVTTICKHGCPFCYKSNTCNGKNMDTKTFIKIFNALPKSITQIAFGADYDLSSNSSIFTMMHYAKQHNVIPNVTVGYLDDTRADLVSYLCGAVAVSRYEDKDACFDTVKKLTDRGMTQVNIHQLVSEETYTRCIETLNAAAEDPRLSKLNAVVFLMLKQKGRGEGYHPISDSKFKVIVDLAKSLGINIGFDSCGSYKAIKALGPEIKKYVLDCESTLQSMYINAEGKYYPCSFCEGEKNWEEGLDVLECKDPKDFIEKIWNHERTKQFRDNLLNTAKCNECGCRTCPMFKV